MTPAHPWVGSRRVNFAEKTWPRIPVRSLYIHTLDPRKFYPPPINYVPQSPTKRPSRLLSHLAPGVYKRPVHGLLVSVGGNQTQEGNQTAGPLLTPPLQPDPRRSRNPKLPHQDRPIPRACS